MTVDCPIVDGHDAAVIDASGVDCASDAIDV